MVTAGAQRGPTVLGLRLPAPESDARVWAGRLLFVVAGTAVAWFLTLMVSGQARAETPPVAPSTASSVTDAHQPASLAADPAAVTTSALPTSAVATSALTPSAGIPAAPIDVDDLFSLRALDQQTPSDPAGPVGASADVGDDGPAVVDGVIAAAEIPGPAGKAAPEASDAPSTVTPYLPVQAPEGLSVPPRRPTVPVADVPAAHGMRADPAVVPERGRPSVSALERVTSSLPVLAGERPSTAAASPADAGLPRLPLPESPGPCAGASTTTASGSGGNELFDGLSALGSRHAGSLRAGSTAVAPSSDGNAIRAQARPEPRPD